MKRIIVGVVLLCSVVGISHASAQTAGPHFSQGFVRVDESSGTIVVTLRKYGPGRVQYRTEDGSCQTRFVSPTTTCGAPYARAPGDYGAVSGEVVFTERDGGSRQITVPIVNDSQDEGLEKFMVVATDGAEMGTVEVSIIDDDGDIDDADDPGPAPTSTTPIRDRVPGSGPITVPPAVGVPPTPTTSRSRGPGVEIAFGELKPGPGFELTSDEGARRAPDGQEESGGSATSLALGLGAAAAATGGVAMAARRRRQWSPTR